MSRGNGRWPAAGAGHVQGDLGDRWHAVFPAYPQAAAHVFLVMWFVTSQKNGLSAWAGSAPSASAATTISWAWLQKLRRAMGPPAV